MLSVKEPRFYALVLLSGLAILLTSLFAPLAEAKPKRILNWDVNKLELELEPGTSQTIELWFDSKKKIRNPIFKISKPLRQFVSIIDAPEHIEKGANCVTIKVTIPDERMTTGFVMGALKVRAKTGSKKRKKIRKKLPIAILIEGSKPVFTSPSLPGVSIEYPIIGNDLVLVENAEVNSQINIDFLTNWNDDPAFPVEQATLTFKENSGSLTLDAWLDAEHDPNRILRDEQSYRFYTFDNGVVAYVKDGVFPSTPLESGPRAELFALSPLGDYLITFRLGHENTWREDLGDTVSRTDILVQIVEDLSF